MFTTNWIEAPINWTEQQRSGRRVRTAVIPAGAVRIVVDEWIDSPFDEPFDPGDTTLVVIHQENAPKAATYVAKHIISNTRLPKHEQRIQNDVNFYVNFYTDFPAEDLEDIYG